MPSLPKHEWVLGLRKAERKCHRVYLGTASVVGLAVGFGAQSLSKDYFNGFFILLENQIRQGDVIEVCGKDGTVEASPCVTMPRLARKYWKTSRFRASRVGWTRQ